MAYKKYIKRGGKVYGPYIYHSKRVDGKVVSEYRGVHSKKIDYKKFLWIGLTLLVVAVLTFGVSFLGKGITGKATFDVKVDYKEGEALDGVLKLSLKEGELLPASSKLVFENNGEKYKYDLADIISDETIEGDFYVEGKEVSGSGSGYGIKGVKEASSVVYFTLEVYKDQETTEELEGKETEELGEEVAPLGVPQSIPKDGTRTSNEAELGGKESGGPGITGGVISSFFGRITGNVVMELQTGIDGQVSVDNIFTHTLNEGETVEIKPKSVRTDFKGLNDNVIDLEINDNEVTVTTDYSEEEEGFGQDYLGQDTKTLKIDLSNLNLMLGAGDLKISLIYFEEELISLTTVLQEGETSETQVEEAKEIKEVEEVPEPEVIVPSGIDLTDEERAILIKEFGVINIETIREEIKGDRLIIGFKLRDYKIEHTYNYPQTEENLQAQIKIDLNKWLKDIVATLLRKASVSQSVDIIEDNYVL